MVEPLDTCTLLSTMNTRKTFEMTRQVNIRDKLTDKALINGGHRALA